MVVLLQMMLQMFLRWVDTNGLEQDCSEDNKSSSYPVIPEDRFTQVPVGEEHSHDDAQVPEQGDCRDW